MPLIGCVAEGEGWSGETREEPGPTFWLWEGEMEGMPWI